MIEDDIPTKYCRFRAGQQISFGIIEDGHVFELDSAPSGAHNRTNVVHELSAVKLLVPTSPGAIIRVGKNYGDYLDRSVSKQQALSPDQPSSIPLLPAIRYESGAALIAHDDVIVKPQDSAAKLHYEGELVAVFAKAGKNISREEALSYVLGWTIGNDVNDRNGQPSDGAGRRPRTTSKPMGPWIVKGIDPNEMVTTVQINGTITDRFRTGDMIFDAATCISEVSKRLAIHAGDVLWLGTSGTSPELSVGDVVEINISGIGTLRNRIVSDG